jgi:hypothetical protein
VWIALVYLYPTDSIRIGDAYAAYRQNAGDGMTTLMEGNVFARAPTDPSVPTESHLPPTFPSKTFRKYFHIRDAVDSDFKSDVR